MKRFLAEILAGLAKHHGHEIHLYSRRFEDLQVTPFDNRKHDSSQCIFWHRVSRLAVTHSFAVLPCIFANRHCRPRTLWLQHLHFDAFWRERGAQGLAVLQRPSNRSDPSPPFGFRTPNTRFPLASFWSSKTRLTYVPQWLNRLFSVPKHGRSLELPFRCPLSFSVRPCHLYSSFGLPAFLVVPTMERFLRVASRFSSCDGAS